MLAWRACLLGLTSALLFATASNAEAVPLNVRARAKVELDHKKTRDGLELEGRLLDDEGRPIADERLSLTLGERDPESLTTDGDGRFRLTLDRRSTAALERAHERSDGGKVPWQARFPGSRRISDVVASGAVDLSRRASRLTLTLRDDTTERLRVKRLLPNEGQRTLLARLEEPLSSLPLPDAEIRLRVGDGAELIGRTGGNGQVAFLISPDQLEAGALYRATARFAGDSLHVPALAELELQVQRPTRLTLRVVREGDARHGRYRFSGRLADQDGALGNAVVAIEGRVASPDEAENTQEIAIERLVATDEDGLFVTAIDAAELDERRLTRLLLVAHFQPATAAHAPSRSRPVLLEVPPPDGIPAGWYLIALSLLSLILGLAHAHRTGALARFYQRLRERLRALTTRPDPIGAATPHRASAPIATNVARGRGDWLSGRVIDGHEGTCIIATLKVRDISGERELETDASGHFALGPLATGPCHLELCAPGFLSRELDFEAPHTGLYDGATWSLVAVKRKLRDIFGETVGELGGELAWGRDTPREALTKALSRQADRDRVERPLAELTMLVERAHFARGAAEPSSVEQAKTLQREVGSRGAPQAAPDPRPS